MFQIHNQREISHSLTQNSSLECKNVVSHPSLEIGFLTSKNEEGIASPCQSMKDFTTPEGGLSRHISKDILKNIPSENVALKVPDTYFLHHFVYNCRTSTFTSNNDSRRSKSRKSNDNELKNTMSCECARNLQPNTENINSKSTTEIVLQIPKRCHEDSLVDIKLIGTALALHPSVSSEGEELNYIDLSSESEKKRTNKVNDTCGKCNVPLGLEKVDTENYRIIASSEEDTCHICTWGEQSGLNETSTNNDANRISIKLGENLILSLVTDTDEPENKSSQGCNIQTDSEVCENFPSIKILVKCNGETIKEISSPRLRDGTNEKNYNQIFCVNACNEHSTYIETDVCTSTSCDKKSRKDDILPIEYCQTYMTVNTALGSMPSSSYMKPKCNLMQEIKPPDSCCTKCPLLSNACGFVNPAPSPQRKGSQQSKKNNQKQSINKKSDKKGKSKNAAKKQQSSSSLRNSISKKGSTSEPESSLCACPTDKNDIASLGSFSLFFIINDMNTGDCSCVKSGSNELLETAMICVHVDNSMGDKRNQMKKTSSCPAVLSSFNTQGNMTDKTAGSICSCPSRTSKSSSCSCPSVRTPPASSNCSCPSAQSPKGYVCPYSKAKDQKSPVTQSTNTSLRSSLHRNPCCQPSQLRFSVSIQAQQGTANQCQSCSAHQSQREQTSVQVCPSQRTACVQPSSTGQRPQPQGVQTSISQKSACVQPSTPTCSQARQVLSNICPPSCKINLPTTVSSIVVQKLPCTPTKRTPTCDMKAGPSYTSTVAKSSSCPSMKQNVGSPMKKQSSCCVNDFAATQSKSCSLCISVSKLNDSRDPSLKRVCSFSGECKKDTSKSKLTSSCTSVKSKTSCSICKELSKLGPCDEEPTSKGIQGRPRVIPASAKLKRTKNFNQLSHLDVSGADNFIYGENRRGDLTLRTADYSDLKEAFEKFMVAENAKNPKCKYIKKC